LDGFEEIKHLRSRAPEKIFYQIIKINKTQMGPYMALIVPSSFYGIDAGLHALSFPLGVNVQKLYLK
jgi:hypothetical protein